MPMPMVLPDSHDQESHVTPHFDNLDLRNAVVTDDVTNIV